MNSSSPPNRRSVSVSTVRFFVRYRRTLISLVLCTIALAAGAGAFEYLAALKQPPSTRQQAEKVYNVEVFDVERCNLQEIISGFGTARSDREVVVDAQVSGEVLSVHARLEIGEAFRAAETTVGEAGRSQRSLGDLLATIDPATYAERLTQVENRIAEAKTDLQRLDQEATNNARLLRKVSQDYKVFEKEYDRVKSLVEKKIKTPSDLVQA